MDTPKYSIEGVIMLTEVIDTLKIKELNQFEVNELIFKLEMVRELLTKFIDSVEKI